MQVVHLSFRQDPSGFWSVSSVDMPGDTKLVAGDWNLDEARRLAREAVAFAFDADQVPDDVRIVEVPPDHREAL
ncbi:MAG TPA: hypothetical protein VFD04_18800 [Actinomycetes bacterium]|jgi:hypothetical protein|nr:hypothetical protein [Actinomycetes bacterium]